MKGYIVLEDGTVMEGKAFGCKGTVAAELCFHTEMAGYEDICSEPANDGQIIVMTYPLQGNYGFSREDLAKGEFGPVGVIVKDFSEMPSHYQCETTLEDFFEKKHIFGLSYVDTRMLARKAANKTILKCCLTTEEPHVGLIDKHFKLAPVASGAVTEMVRIKGEGGCVAVLDLGSMRGMMKTLEAECANVVIFPHTASADSILAEKPERLIITHGGGDPRQLFQAVETVKKLYGSTEIYGIGMGALILGAALGISVGPLPGNGYRGVNYPVMNVDSGKVTLTAQNIAFGVRGLDHKHAHKTEDFQITYTSVNDGGIQGFKTKHCEAVIFLPEPEIVAGWLHGCNNESGGLSNV